MRVSSFPKGTCARCGHLDSCHEGGTGKCMPDCKYACDGVTKPALKTGSVPHLAELARLYALAVGDDCLCQRTQPGTPVGECTYNFCGCQIWSAYIAGARAALTFAATSVHDIPETNALGDKKTPQRMRAECADEIEAILAEELP